MRGLSFFAPAGRRTAAAARRAARYGGAGGNEAAVGALIRSVAATVCDAGRRVARFNVQNGRRDARTRDAAFFADFTSAFRQFCLLPPSKSHFPLPATCFLRKFHSNFTLIGREKELAALVAS